MLDITHYRSGRLSWDCQLLRDPMWQDVESAIRRLDRSHWPFVLLHSIEPVKGEQPRHALWITGGRGEYKLELSMDGDEIHYFDPTRSDHEVRVDESDVGLTVREKDLCRDVEKVLEIARWYADHASLHPGYCWERW
ncbi:MAG TPA: hypothetical protein VF796_01925 [Humisphaera sp.]